MPNETLSAFLSRIRTALTNAKTEADVQAALAPFGYDSERIDAGLSLLDTAETEAARQQGEYAEQYSATQTAQQTEAALRSAYMRHVKLSRVAFKPGTPAYLKLRLSGERARDTSGLLRQSRTFYATIASTPDIQTALSAFTVDAAAVSGAQDQIAALDAALAAQAKETGEAQMATRTRDAAAAELRGYFSDFVTVAKIATEETPQLREKLGLLERS